MQYTEIFKVVKNEKSFAIVLIFAQNIDCGYTLEPPRRGLRGYSLHGHVFLMNTRTMSDIPKYLIL